MFVSMSQDSCICGFAIGSLIILLKESGVNGSTGDQLRRFKSLGF